MKKKTKKREASRKQAKVKVGLTTQCHNHRLTAKYGMSEHQNDKAKCQIVHQHVGMYMCENEGGEKKFDALQR